MRTKYNPDDLEKARKFQFQEKEEVPTNDIFAGEIQQLISKNMTLNEIFYAIGDAYKLGFLVGSKQIES